MDSTSTTQAARVVIVGAGFGGLEAARALRNAPVEVWLVDRNNYHTFQPLLYQVATAGLEPEEIAHAVRSIYHGQANFHFVLGEVCGIHWERKELTLRAQAPVAFDYLILAAGTTTNDYGIEGVAEFAFGLKSLAQAVQLRTHILSLFEAVANEPALIDEGALNFVVSGGGATGVEMSGALVELFDMVLRKDYPALDMRRARVILIERDQTLLMPYHERSRAYALAQLRRRGVEVLLGRSVVRATETRIVLDGGEELATRTLIWAAGVRAADLATVLDLERARAGRIVVEPDLSVPGRPEVFVIGDLAAAKDAQGALLPQQAPVAIQAGRHAARMIERRLTASASEAFVYKDRGTMATIGRNAAVAELRGGIRARGRIAWVMWLALHLVQLIGFRNRASVLLNWVWNYFTYDRAARLISAGDERPASSAAAPRD